MLSLLLAVMQTSSFSFHAPTPDSFEVRWRDKPVLAASGVGPRVEPARAVEPCESLFLGYPHGPKTAEFVPPGRERETYTMVLERIHGTISASADAFACTDDPKVPLGSTFGRPVIEGANAVYDRTGDWLISVEGGPVSIQPVGNTEFSIECAVPCTVRFKPNYYRDHLGYFLWDKSKPLWKEPVAGWCSWMAHLQGVTERDVLAAARFFSENLKAYGYDIVQIDDGYQRVLQFGQDNKGGEPFSNYWTRPNEKFPHGMEALAHEIKALGMTPGVWVGYYLPLGLQHKEGYVTDPDGQPHKGPWVNYAMNGLDGPARDEAYIDTIRQFKRQGWDYFKIDTLRHVLYDSYRQVPDYWKARGESMEAAYRTILAETKKAAKDSYVLACWGTIPELAGLADGARIGEDVGPDFDSMRRSAKYIAQFQYLNNVVWRNDPDYMCFRVPIDQARAWATLTFLAGGHLMVSDPIAAYDAAHLDALRRVGPPIFTRPLNVVSHGPDPEFMTLNAEKGGEQWTVMARFAWQDLPAREVATPGKGRFLAFDFWNEEFLGSVEAASFRALPKGQCQVLSLRPDLGRPQVLGTNRHLSQGAYELENVRWANDRLSGRFLRGPGQAWSVFIRVPAGWKVVEASVPHALDGEVLKLTFPVGGDPAGWSVRFSKGALH
ncbi:MAG: hypothetical protein M9921_05330 [Fimbriimonadaceae bacterium]|nr:hypothetical protein [Chthonomonadaceae bacterium]MCO5296262.1 hypothetical protein [Fimbriimonadaceae bacterium]